MAGFLKSLELANKVLWKRFFSACFHRKQAVIPERLRSVRKVLFIRYDKIGDMIVSTPMFRGIRAIDRSIVVGVIASEENARVIGSDTNVDHIHVFSRLKPFESLKEIVRARKIGYDAAVNLNLNDSLTGSLIANLCVPDGIKVARDSQEHRLFYDLLLPIQRENNRPMVELLLPFLEVFGTLPTKEMLKPYLVVRDDTRRRMICRLNDLGLEGKGADEVDPFVLVSLSAGKPTRQWNEAGYEELVREILNRDSGVERVVLLSHPRDREIRENLLEKLAEYPVHAYPSTDDLMEIAALIGLARAIISPDTSIIHFASAMGTPIVGLYTTIETNPLEWQPYGVPYRSIFAERGMPVSSITSEAVISEIIDLLKEMNENE